MKTYIKIRLWKFSLFQALVPPVFFFVFNAYTGFKLPFDLMIWFSLISAIIFALAGAAIATLVLDAVLANDELQNPFKSLGRGSVRLSHAKGSFSPGILFILLKDDENGSCVRIPRPFWADDPELVNGILKQADSNQNQETGN